MLEVFIFIGRSNKYVDKVDEAEGQVLADSVEHLVHLTGAHSSSLVCVHHSALGVKLTPTVSRLINI